MDCDQQGLVTVTIEDNGIGMDDEGDMMQHYGVPIMKERAEHLGEVMSRLQAEHRSI
jgi:two-component system nitrate/nitrite sensor histidine kinase NarX